MREQQSRQFSLGWPLLRRCALQLGEQLAQHGSIAGREDIFFLTRADLQAALANPPISPLPEAIRERHEHWERQRRLTAPLELGKAPAAARRIVTNAIEAARTAAHPQDAALVGEPASPGRASGHVHIILDPTDFAAFKPGEVLVAPAQR